MPPSPSLRHSPGVETHGDSRRRGRSLEYGLSFKLKGRDDDLTLFNEMQSREIDNFLLQPTDDFEDILTSKPKPFPDLKLGINIPARGESSNLLNADGDKNDYDWLLTPPETPLFRSLDDEPAPANLVPGGRERSRPISISRSATMERNRRSRGSPSPQRLSPSQSGSGAFCGRPSSAPHASPIPLRPSSPSRRPSPPPVKSSTTPRRSSTPTSRRSSTGSGGSRGNSPIRTSSGNLASPKITAWQSNIPGLALDAPPNLRTSLADRPASYVRGSSPASRTSTNSSSKFGRRSISPAASRNVRRSMSPAASRSISSSQSQERDKLSSHSRGSLASSGDDDADSLQSFSVRVSESTTSRKGVGSVPGGKPSAFSKKSTKTSSANSVPKRSFDSAMRQMDRRSPQNMFRPLLSGVPNSTFHVGQASFGHHGMASRNSSVTTSSNTEGNDQYQDDMASDCATSPYTVIQDEVFAFDKMDIANDITGPKARDIFLEPQPDEPDKTCAFASNGDGVQGGLVKIVSLEDTLFCSRCVSRYHPNELSEGENNICPECEQKGEILRNPASLISTETNENGPVPSMNISDESNITDPNMAEPRLQIAASIHHPMSVSEMQEDVTLGAERPSIGAETTTPNSPVPLINISEESDIVDPTAAVPQSEILIGTDYQRSVSEMKEEIMLEAKGPEDSCLEQSVAMVSLQLLSEENRSVHDQSRAASDGSEDMHKCSEEHYSNIEQDEKCDPDIDAAEGAGTSVLLSNRSCSAKTPDSEPNSSILEQSMAMVSGQMVTEENRGVHDASRAAHGSPDVLKFNDKPNSNIDVAKGAGISVLLLKRSSSAKGPLVHSRTLNSSTISYDDLSYTRDLSTSMMSSTGFGSISTISSVDLSSARHPEMVVRRHSSGKRSDTSSKPQSTVSSLSGSSMQVYQGLGLSTVSREESCDECSSNMSNIVAGETPRLPSDHVLLVENTESSVSKTVMDEEINYGISVTCGENNASAMDQHTVCNMLEDHSRGSIVLDEGHVLHEVHEGHEKVIGIVPNVEEPVFLQSSIAEESTQTDKNVEVERADDPTQCSLTTMSEIEIDDSHTSSPKSQIEMVSKEDLEDHSPHLHPNNDAKSLSPESTASDHGDRLVEEESTVIVESQGGRRTRSLTLEEATDTILFCSSIIHDLAYKAASIAVEKEKENLEPNEVPRPTITIPERRAESHGTTAGKTVKTQKARKRRGETESKPKPPPLTENENKSNEPEVRTVGIPDNAGTNTMKSPKLESKCNCTIM